MHSLQGFAVTVLANLFARSRVAPGRFARISAVLLLAVVPLVAIGAPAAPMEPALVAYGASHDRVTPIHVKVILDRLPILGQETIVTCEVTADLYAPGTTATIELPANARYIGGELAWNGDIMENETISFSAKITFDAPGDTAILGRALRKIDARNSWGDLAAAYLSVGGAKSRAGFVPVPQELREHDAGVEKLPTGILINPPSVPRSDQSAVPPPPAHDAIPPASGRPSEVPCPAVDEKPGPPEQQLPCGNFSTMPKADDASWEAEPLSDLALPQAGNLTVTGHWSYYDRDDVNTDASEFLVELIRGDDSAHLAWCFTDLSGDYSCGPVTNPGSVGMRTSVYSWTSFSPNPDTLAVVNPDWGTTNDKSNAFVTRTGVVALGDGTQSIGSWSVNNGSSYERAYWTLHDLIEVWRYVHFNGSEGEAGPTTVEWKIDSTDGTFYRVGENVHLMGVDPLSPAGSSAKHEYGHNIMYNAYNGYYPPHPNCSGHTIPAAYSAGCAWTEGWAEFLSYVVNNDPTEYWPSGAGLDIENPTWGTPGWDDGDWVEGRVAGAMWDMFDAHNDGYDTYSEGTLANFWDVFYHVRSDTFSEWWASWLARGHNNVSAGPLWQNTIDYLSPGPSNDNFADRATISSVPFRISGLDTSHATTQGRDPSHPCASVTYSQQSRSVWYAYTPSTNGVYNINTIGSSYDTVLAVWRGSWGALVNLGCNDDSSAQTSSLNLALYAGTTYFIEVSDWGMGSGGSLSLSVTRQHGDVNTVDARFSGNWFDPAQSGHGFLLEGLPDNRFYATWYAFWQGQPLFLQGVAVPDSDRLTLDMFSARSSGFPVGGAGAQVQPWGQLSFTFSDLNTGHVAWLPSAAGFTAGSMNVTRLTAPASPQSDRQGVGKACRSGIWYKPSHPGYGFNLEVDDNPDGSRVIQTFWYTYYPNGSPLWLFGVAPLTPQGANVDLYLADGAGAQFPDAFDPETLERKSWGQVQLRFNGDDLLNVTYVSALPGYGSGNLTNLHRLTVLEGRDCTAN